jgi:hypothetical protein
LPSRIRQKAPRQQWADPHTGSSSTPSLGNNARDAKSNCGSAEIGKGTRTSSPAVGVTTRHLPPAGANLPPAPLSEQCRFAWHGGRFLQHRHKGPSGTCYLDLAE